MYSAFEGLETRVGDCTNHMDSETNPNSGQLLSSECVLTEGIVRVWSGIAELKRIMRRLI